MTQKILLLISTACCACALPSQAQEAKPAATADSTRIPEIVVTAERFATNIQTTPVSVEVYSGESLQEKNIFSLRDLPRIDASLNFLSVSGHEGLALRGISTSNGTETGEPSVSVAVDGTFNNRGYSLRSALYDIERIEILRGPQGTLFGRNTTGGLINIITRRPQQDFSASVTADLGSYSAKHFEGYVNLPVTNTLAARVSFMTRDRTGYTVNDFNQRGNDDDTASFRAQLQWTPTDALKFWASVSMTDDGGVGALSEIIPFRFANPARPFEPLHNVQPTSDGKHYPVNGRAGQSIKTKDVKFSAEYHLPGGIAFTYLGGYNKIDLFRPGPLLFRGVQSAFTRREHPKTWNHEVRISSAPDGRLTWQFGGQIFDEKSSLDTDLVANPGTASPTELYRFLTPFVHQNSKAVFGQASYELIDNLKFSAGARYTDDKKERRGNFFIRRAFTGAPVDIVQTQNGFAKSDKVTWLAGLDYEATPDNFLYARVSTGYRAGGFTGPAQYDPETVRSYEIGTKNQLFDNHVQLNISAFYMDYLDQQVTQYQSVNGSPPQAITANAGASRIYGVESSMTIKMGQAGTLTGAVNYLHARYRRFLTGAPWSNPQNPLVGVVQLNLAGYRLPAAPDWTLTADWEKTFDDVWGGEVTFNVNGKYQSTVYFAPTNFIDQKQKGFALLNGSLGYKTSDGKWGVDFYFDNLFDKKYFGYADEIYPYSSYVFAYGAPRTYGVRANANF